MADLARIATDVIDADRRLLGWFARSRPVRTLRPVYEPAADRLRWWTRGPYPRLLRRIGDSWPGESVLRLLEVAPATERSTGPRPVASLRDVLRTVDTTRAWLQQHPQTTHLAHARAVARLAVTITRGAAGSDAEVHPGSAADAYRWDQIAKKLQDLGELGAGNRDHLVGELVAANDWLHRQLRAHEQTRPAGTASDPSWREALSTLQGRLPALANQIDRVVAAAAAQGQLCVPQAELDMSAPGAGSSWPGPAGGRRGPQIAPSRLCGANSKAPPGSQLTASRLYVRLWATRRRWPVSPSRSHPHQAPGIGESAQSLTGAAKTVAAPRRWRGRTRG